MHSAGTHNTRIAGVVLGLALCVAGAGWAQDTVSYSVGPRFTKRTPPKSVEEALYLGDLFRNEAHKLLRTGVKPLDGARYHAEQAKKYYSYVLESLEPHNAYAALNLGYIPLMLAQYEGARKEREFLLSQAKSKLMDAEAKRRGYAAAHVYLGELYAAQKNWDQAEKEFASLIKSGISDAYVYAWYGYVLSKRGNASAAKAAYRKAVDDGDPAAAAEWAKQRIR